MPTSRKAMAAGDAEATSKACVKSRVRYALRRAAGSVRGEGGRLREQAAAIVRRLRSAGDYWVKNVKRDSCRKGRQEHLESLALLASWRFKKE